jgi:hypothetical protein
LSAIGLSAVSSELSAEKKREDLTAEKPESSEIVKERRGRRHRPKETDVLHVPYFQYDGLGGVIGTLGRVRYPVQDGVVRRELRVSGG